MHNPNVPRVRRSFAYGVAPPAISTAPVHRSCPFPLATVDNFSFEVCHMDESRSSSRVCLVIRALPWFDVRVAEARAG